MDHTEIRAFAHLCFCDWTPDAMRRAYETIVATWTEAGVPPNQLAATVPGVGNNFGSFKHKRKRLENTNFENTQRYSLSHLIEGGIDPVTEAQVYVCIDHYFKRATLSWIPAMIGGPVRLLIDLLHELAALGRAQFGHRLHRNMLDKNRPWWLIMPELMRDGFLFDVYHHNYLNEAHLDAPFGKTAMTVREWIECEPSRRGELKPFTNILSEWTPPRKNIPVTREELFRAGRVYYHRFFAPYRHRDRRHGISASGALKYQDQSVVQPEPFYRPNVNEPWEWTGLTPDIFRAEYYKGVDDPALVYPMSSSDS